MGAILSHITGGGNAETFQPMNVNFGLFPYIAEPTDVPRKDRPREKKKLMAIRALDHLDKWLKQFENLKAA